MRFVRMILGASRFLLARAYCAIIGYVPTNRNYRMLTDANYYKEQTEKYVFQALVVKPSTN